MDLVTVTCTIDKYHIRLQAHTLNLFVTKPVVHYVCIEDAATSEQEWLDMLMPLYTRHELRLVYAYSRNSVFREGYFNQQKIKLLVAGDYIQSDHYMVLDSKNWFFKDVDFDQWLWPHSHGVSYLLDDAGIRPRFRNWVTEYCQTNGIAEPTFVRSMTTPFKIKTALAKQITRAVDIDTVLTYNCESLNMTPSEFLLYTVHAYQDNPEEWSINFVGMNFAAYSLRDIVDNEPDQIVKRAQQSRRSDFEFIEQHYCTIAIHRDYIKAQNINTIMPFYNWLLLHGISKDILDDALFLPMITTNRIDLWNH